MLDVQGVIRYLETHGFTAHESGLDYPAVSIHYSGKFAASMCDYLVRSFSQIGMKLAPVPADGVMGPDEYGLEATYFPVIPLTVIDIIGVTDAKLVAHGVKV